MDVVQCITGDYEQLLLYPLLSDIKIQFVWYPQKHYIVALRIVNEQSYVK